MVQVICLNWLYFYIWGTSFIFPVAFCDKNLLQKAYRWSINKKIIKMNVQRWFAVTEIAVMHCLLTARFLRFGYRGCRPSWNPTALNTAASTLHWRWETGCWLICELMIWPRYPPFFSKACKVKWSKCGLIHRYNRKSRQKWQKSRQWFVKIVKFTAKLQPGQVWTRVWSPYSQPLVLLFHIYISDRKINNNTNSNWKTAM